MDDDQNETRENLSEDEFKILENLKCLEEFASSEDLDNRPVSGIVQVVKETMALVADSIDGDKPINIPKQILELLDCLDQVSKSQEIRKTKKTKKRLFYLYLKHSQKIEFHRRTGDWMIEFLIDYNTATYYQM